MSRRWKALSRHADSGEINNAIAIYRSDARPHPVIKSAEPPHSSGHNALLAAKQAAVPIFNAKLWNGCMAVVQETITMANARDRFEAAARQVPSAPDLHGTGILICAGGPFVPSAYVVVRLLRKFGVKLPIELWYAGQDEFPHWARRAFVPYEVTHHDVAAFFPDRPLNELQGWPIKTAALVSSKLRHTLFLDADCFPLRDPTFLLSSDEYASLGALFWPHMKTQFLTPDATIWRLTGLPYQNDSEFESGILAIDKQRCWRELCLAHWMNANSSFWYNHVLGDKDTFYLAWHKLGSKHFLGPPCRRFKGVITRHFWTDGRPLVDHREGTSKYAIPWRIGPFCAYLMPHKYRPWSHNIYNEIMQRILVRDFSFHARCLRDFAEMQQLPRKSAT